MKAYLAQAVGRLAGNVHSSPVASELCKRALAIALTHPEPTIVAGAAKGLGFHGASELAGLQYAAVELVFKHARMRRMVDFKYRGPGCDAELTWDNRRQAMHADIQQMTDELRARFIAGEPADLKRLVLFYPRGYEENEVLGSMVAILHRQQTETAQAVASRALKWLSLQWSSKEPHFRRLFGQDKWRSHDVSGPMPTTLGEVSDGVARHILNQPPAEAVRLVKRHLDENLQGARLGDRAGELLKDLCLELDATGSSDTFWAVWEEYRDFAFYLGSRLQNEKLMKAAKISNERWIASFSHFVSAIFLNNMYMRPDQEWAPLSGREHLFSDAFSRVGAYGINQYVGFLNTIGSKLLPDAWEPLAACLRKIEDLNLARGFLTSKSRGNLLRLIQREVTTLRIQAGDKAKWEAVRHLLDYLVDESLPEAHRIREGLPRFLL